MFHKKHFIHDNMIFGAKKTGEIGEKGEDLACKFLKKNEFKVLERNYKKKWGEIDIISQKQGSIHFVEVKTVTRRTLDDKNDYQPEDNIHPQKLKRLARTMETYLLEKDIDDEVDWQLDAISVYLDKERDVLKIDYMEDIF